MRFSTYKQKMDQATREAKATVVALVVTIAVWIVLGFGLSGLDIQLFHTPLWVIGGTLGIYLMSILVVVCLRAFVFEDFDLDDQEESNGREGNVSRAANVAGRQGAAEANVAGRQGAAEANVAGRQGATKADLIGKEATNE